MIIPRTIRIPRGCLPGLLAFALFSCNSKEEAEYEVLNTVMDQCIFKATDPERIGKIADREKISLKEALEIDDAEMKGRQYTFMMSDTLLAADLPESVWSYLHSYDIFENKTADEPIPVDFSKIRPLENRQRVNRPRNNNRYLGYFRFHRVLFDPSGETAYLRVDIPDSPGRISGSFGLMMRKENGKWKKLH